MLYTVLLLIFVGKFVPVLLFLAKYFKLLLYCKIAKNLGWAFEIIQFICLGLYLFDYNWLNNTNIDNERRNYFLNFFHAIQQVFPIICMPIIINDIGKKEINIS